MRLFVLITALLLSGCVSTPSETAGVQVQPVSVHCPHGDIDTHVETLKGLMPGLEHRIVMGAELEVFRSALNRTPPVTEVEFDRIDAFVLPSNPGVTGVYFTNQGCWIAEMPYRTQDFIRLMNGQIGPFPVNEEPTKEPERPSA